MREIKGRQSESDQAVRELDVIPAGHVQRKAAHGEKSRAGKRKIAAVAGGTREPLFAGVEPAFDFLGVYFKSAT